MRRYLLGIGVLLVCYACENRISTIGQNFWDTPSSIRVNRYELENTSTIRLDSFLTTRFQNEESGTMVVGKMNDRVSGTTETVTHFQLYPVGVKSSGIDMNEEYVVDSLLLEFTGAKVIAGDTVTMQTYHLHRIPELPEYDIRYPYFFSNQEVPLGERIASVNLYPQVDNLVRTYFKIEGTLGRELFNMIAAQDDILMEGNHLEFARFFKGMAIVPDAANTNMLSVNSTFELSIYYHIGGNEASSKQLKFNNTSAKFSKDNPYTFTQIIHTPTPAFEGITGIDSIPFSRNNVAVIQGLNGYMLKLKLPYIPEADRRNSTILRVDLEFKPRLEHFEDIKDIGTLYGYITDELNNIQSVLTSPSGNELTGTVEASSANTEKRRYLMEITDFYHSFLEYGKEHDNMHLLIGLRGSPFRIDDWYYSFSGNVSTTFDRVVINEPPAIIITTLQYRN